MAFSEPMNWRAEATAVIDDIKKHVQFISISDILEESEREIFLNCETKEKKQLTIRLSVDGYQIVGQKFDTKTNDTNVSYETIYSLLGAISPGYISSFGSELAIALYNLAEPK